MRRRAGSRRRRQPARGRPGPEAATVLRIPRGRRRGRGCTACPRSTPSRVEARRQAARRSSGTVGADADQGLVFLLDTQAQRGRARPGDPPDPSIAGAGPPGHRGPRRRALRRGHRQQRRDRGPASHAGAVPLNKLQGAPRDLDATMGGTPARSPRRATSPRLEVLGSDQPGRDHPRRRRTTGRRASGATWSPWPPTRAVVLYEIQGDSDGDRDRSRSPSPARAKAVMFSPSGHRIYVARDDRGAARPRPLSAARS